MNNIQRFYEKMNEGVANYGELINKQFGKVVEYEIHFQDHKETIVMDFKNKYNNFQQHGAVYLKSNKDKYLDIS